MRGYIRAEAKNNTGEYINAQGIEFNFYNKEGKYLGNKTSVVRNLDLGEKEKISLEYNFEGVSKIEVNLSEKEFSSGILFDTEGAESLAVWIGLIIGLSVLIP